MDQETGVKTHIFFGIKETKMKLTSDWLKELKGVGI